MKVLNFGSLNLDYVYDVDHFVREGETISSADMNVFCGGKGLNQSVALAKAGVKVYHAGAVGSADGSMLLEALSNVGADDKGDILLLQNEVSNLSFIIDEGYKRGMSIVLNPSPINEKIFECDLEKVEYLILNEIEAADILGASETGEDELIEKLTKRFPGMKIVLTLGEKGSVYVDKTQKIRQEIYKADVVDTTAAGDTFTGYFIAGLVAGIDVAGALKQAAKAASITVSRKGASPSIPFAKEVCER